MDALESAQFARVELKREEIPISWEDALELLAAQNGRYYLKKPGQCLFAALTFNHGEINDRPR
jgi:hypothetical protein